MAGDDIFQQAVRLHTGGDPAGAERLYRRVLASNPRHADALHLSGLARFQQGDPDRAARLIRRAIAYMPNTPPFYGNLGTVLSAMGNAADARAAYEKAVAIDPAYADGWRNLGSLCARMEDHEAAARAYNQLVRLTGGKDGQALGFLGLSMAVLCEWSEMDLLKGVLANVPDWRQSKESGAGLPPVPPFTLVVHDVSPAEFRYRADLTAAFIKAQALQGAAPFAHRPYPRRDRLRIGYLSEDFHEHATAYLMAEMLESHDRSRFEIFAYAYDADDGGPMRKRIQNGVEHFVDILRLNQPQSAARIKEDGIDILVDLKGHTGMARTAILPLRPAPILVEYIGFPGTFGGDYIDYIIADRFVVPEDGAADYSERIVRLPLSYQVNDRARPRPATRPEKRDWGLPDDAFVFCSFNNSFKITERMFGIWLDLLRERADSVVWLLDFHPLATAKLRRVAEEQGIDPARLIFAPRVPRDRHLARIGAADLFIDTYPCGAHTTASDALWCGVPVIALAGRSFASRVAGSLLHALGFGELVTADYESYRALISRLAGDAAELAGLRARLAAAVANSPVFDGARFARDLERAYDRMWDIFAAGEKPEGFAVG